MLLGLCYSTFQSLKGTQKEKYSINTLYDETEVYTEIYITLETRIDALARCAQDVYTQVSMVI